MNSEQNNEQYANDSDDCDCEGPNGFEQFCYAEAKDWFMNRPRTINENKDKFADYIIEEYLEYISSFVTPNHPDKIKDYLRLFFQCLLDQIAV